MYTTYNSKCKPEMWCVTSCDAMRECNGTRTLVQGFLRLSGQISAVTLNHNNTNSNTPHNQHQHNNTQHNHSNKKVQITTISIH